MGKYKSPLQVPAQLILTNAEVVDSNQHGQTAPEIAISQGRIIKVGHGLCSDQELASGARIVNCRGGAVLPGFVDAHIHFFSYVDTLLSLDLRSRAGIGSIARIQGALKELASTLPPGEWIKGKGYSEFALAEKRHPNRWDLDAAAPARPVKLTHRSRHAHVLNSRALQLVGINSHTPDPEGGIIERDPATGRPTGVLFEMGKLLNTLVPRWDPAIFEKAVEQAAGNLASEGICSIVDASPFNDQARLRAFQDLRAKGLLFQRVVMMMGQKGLQKLKRGPVANQEGQGNRIGVWGLKLMLDRTTGSILPSQPDLNRMVLEAHKSGWPVAMHCVEQETLEAALEAIEAAQSACPNKLGHRIEHCSICPPHLARRLAQLGVSVVTQPSFLHFFGERYLASVKPEDLRNFYPMAAWLQNGVALAGSSDCPLVSPSPLTGIYSAVTRLSQNGDLVGPQQADQRLSVRDAVRMFTIGAARAAGLASVTGSIKEGKAADLVVLSSNPLTASQSQIKDIRVLMTLAAGNIIWDAAGL